MRRPSSPQCRFGGIRRNRWSKKLNVERRQCRPGRTAAGSLGFKQNHTIIEHVTPCNFEGHFTGKGYTKTNNCARRGRKYSTCEKSFRFIEVLVETSVTNGKWRSREINVDIQMCHKYGNEPKHILACMMSSRLHLLSSVAYLPLKRLRKPSI